MLIKTEYLSMKSILTLFSLSTLTLLSSQVCLAQAIICDPANTQSLHKMLCSNDFKQQRLSLNEKFLTAYLVTDAPTELLDVSQQLWQKRTLQCQSKQCIKQQFELRSEELNFYTSMNQSLTQHFIKYNQGEMATPNVHVMVHQLSKERLKIEGYAYLNPNNKANLQQSTLLAYTTPNNKNAVVDNDRRCSYKMTFSKAMLVIQSSQKECQRFSGYYRRYD